MLYKDYIEYLQALKLSVVGAGQNTLTDEQISDRVLWWQTNNILTTAAAKSMGITVEPADIKQLEDGLIQQFKTLEAANAELEKRYGWSLKEYEDKIMSTMILQNKLNEKVSLDQKAREEVRNQAEQILDQIKKGADFAEMAKKYGEDGTAGQGGSLGWFGKGDMVPEFEAVAFTLKKGEVSPNLV